MFSDIRQVNFISFLMTKYGDVLDWRNFKILEIILNISCLSSEQKRKFSCSSAVYNMK